MSESTFMGVPREKIPWFPTIDYDKCNYCMECDKFCPHQVFERREAERAETRGGQPEQLRGVLPRLRKTCGPDALAFPEKPAIVAMIKTIREEAKEHAMKYAILPCNGLDKSAGPLAREAALWLVSHEDGELVCPVLLNNSPDRYARVLGELPLLVIDGCATQCATKLANRLGVKIARKLQVAEEVKRMGATLGKSLTLGQDELRLAGDDRRIHCRRSSRKAGLNGKSTGGFRSSARSH